MNPDSSLLRIAEEIANAPLTDAIEREWCGGISIKRLRGFARQTEITLAKEKQKSRAMREALYEIITWQEKIGQPSSHPAAMARKGLFNESHINTNPNENTQAE